MQTVTTEHDKRYQGFQEYVTTGSGDRRGVAQSIRPHLEAFLRVAFPAECTPGTVSGTFLRSCRQSSPGLLTPELAEELDGLREYASMGDLDTIPAWETVEINDGELQRACKTQFGLCETLRESTQIMKLVIG